MKLKILTLKQLKIYFTLTGLVGIMICATVGYMNYKYFYMYEKEISTFLVNVIGIPFITSLLIIGFLTLSFHLLKKYWIKHDMV